MLVAIVAVSMLSQTAGKSEKGPSGPSDAVLEAAGAEYLAAWAKVERKTLRMTQQHAAQFKRSSHKLYVEKIGKKYGLDERQIRSGVRLIENRKAEARKRQEEAARRARLIATRAERNKEGVVGWLEAGAFYSPSYSDFAEVLVLTKADDHLGLSKLEREGRMAAAKTPLNVRIIEVFDYRRINKGHFVRARILSGGYDGKEIYCRPEDIASE
jgi:hypothetical protein